MVAGAESFEGDVNQTPRRLEWTRRLGPETRRWVTAGSVLTLAPPLTITHEELDRALGIVDRCVAEVERG